MGVPTLVKPRGKTVACAHAHAAQYTRHRPAAEGTPLQVNHTEAPPSASLEAKPSSAVAQQHAHCPQVR